MPCYAMLLLRLMIAVSRHDTTCRATLMMLIVADAIARRARHTLMRYTRVSLCCRRRFDIRYARVHILFYRFVLLCLIRRYAAADAARLRAPLLTLPLFSPCFTTMLHAAYCDAFACCRTRINDMP